MLEQELLRVQDRPPHVLKSQAAVSLSGDVLLGGIEFGLRRLARQRCEIQSRDDLVVRFVLFREDRDAAGVGSEFSVDGRAVDHLQGLRCVIHFSLRSAIALA